MTDADRGTFPPHSPSWADAAWDQLHTRAVASVAAYLRYRAGAVPADVLADELRRRLAAHLDRTVRNPDKRGCLYGNIGYMIDAACRAATAGGEVVRVTVAYRKRRRRDCRPEAGFVPAGGQPTCVHHGLTSALAPAGHEGTVLALPDWEGFETVATPPAWEAAPAWAASPLASMEWGMSLANRIDPEGLDDYPTPFGRIWPPEPWEPTRPHELTR